MSNKPLILIDSYNFIFRAYHALPRLLDKNGTPVNAVFGYIKMLTKYIHRFKDSGFIVVADTGKSSFRQALYANYKAHRAPVDDELNCQFPLVVQATRALNILHLSHEGYEADDVIATITEIISTSNNYGLPKDVIIISSDKDLYQLISDRVTLLDPVKDCIIDREAVFKKLGVWPEQTCDLYALAGDASDNIPGIRGIGPKTAAVLLQSFTNVENILANKDRSQTPKMQKMVHNITEDVLLFKKLVSLDRHVPINIETEKLLGNVPDMEALKAFAIEHGFHSLYSKAIVATPDTIPAPEIETGMYESCNLPDLHSSVINNNGLVSLTITETEDDITGITITDEASKIFTTPNVCDHIASLKAIFEDESVVKLASINLSTLMKLYKNYGLRIRMLRDLSVMAYSINMEPSTEEMDNLLLKHNISPGNTAKLHLLHRLVALMIDKSVISVYEKIDRPMTDILLDMQISGIKVDIQELQRLSEGFLAETATVAQQIYDMAGITFNIGSTQQISEILINKLNIPLNKKTKTGNYITNVEILTELAENGIPIAERILRWRHLNKFVNTYTQGLEKHADPTTHRIHTRYKPTATSTGRISSSNPNLQNIPIKSEEGRLIRKAIVAEDGWALVSADYSQIEIRLLAHMADEKKLIAQINLGLDLHTATASEIFNIPIAHVDRITRGRAKSINFGIIYGISAFGLAKQLNIGRNEAAQLIAGYLNNYKKVAQYIEATKKFARTTGYVQTIFGRRCYIPDINSKNAALRNFSERAAVNATLQGSAADILKRAMILLDRTIKRQNMRSKIVLQIHDELTVESPAAEIDSMKIWLRESMENAAALNLKLVATVRSGKNLYYVE